MLIILPIILFFYAKELLPIIQPELPIIQLSFFEIFAKSK